MDMMTRIAALTADCLVSAWPEAEGLPDAGEIRGLLAVPPDPAMGDYAFPVFRLGTKHGMLSISYQGSEGEINAEQISKAMASVDFQHIVALIESGVTGMLVQVQDVLTIWTE